MLGNATTAYYKTRESLFALLNKIRKGGKGKWGMGDMGRKEFP